MYDIHVFGKSLTPWGTLVPRKYTKNEHKRYSKQLQACYSVIVTESLSIRDMDSDLVLR